MREYLQTQELELENGELEAAGNGALGRQRMRQVTQLGQAYALCRDYAHHGELDASQEQAAAMAALTEADIRRVVERYFGEQPLVTVIAR